MAETLKYEKGAFALKDTERYIISNDRDGTARIVLDLDYHARNATLSTIKYKGYPEFDKCFVFKDTDPVKIEIIGNLIREAGKFAKKKLDKDAKYENINLTIND